MRARKPTGLVFVASLFFWCATAVGSRSVQAGRQELPPVTFVCPMAEDEVYEDAPGLCPVCGMELIPVRLHVAYACPNHRAIIAEQPGRCPLDKRELVRVTVALHWECAANPRQHFTESGRCADGTDRRLVRELRAHGDHNPRHGGLFFMAADKWHHLEGTYPGAGLFHLYLYDNYTQPLATEGVTGRVLTLDESNEETGSFPLTVSKDSMTLEAQVTTQINRETAPLRLAALVRFDAKTPEQRFDFAFTDLSTEPGRPVGPTTTTASPEPAAIGSMGSAPVPPRGSLTAAEMAAPLPETSAALLELLGLRSAEVQHAIDDGQFGLVYAPAMVSKDVALALENLAGDLPADRRAHAVTAIRRLVLSAWYLDLYGDMGHGEKLRETYRRFAAAVADIKVAYDTHR